MWFGYKNKLPIKEYKKLKQVDWGKVWKVYLERSLKTNRLWPGPDCPSQSGGKDAARFNCLHSTFLGRIESCNDSEWGTLLPCYKWANGSSQILSTLFKPHSRSTRTPSQSSEPQTAVSEASLRCTPSQHTRAHWHQGSGSGHRLAPCKGMLPFWQHPIRWLLWWSPFYKWGNWGLRGTR